MFGSTFPLHTILRRCKCTFSPYILTFFHLGPYILILPLLVPKPINVCYFCLYILILPLLVPKLINAYYFRLYILILPLLVPKPINACYFRPFRRSIDRNS